MAPTYLEHANITVPDIDAAIAFLQTIEPLFRVRHDAVSPDGMRWAHVGTDDFYIALQAPHPGREPEDLRRPYEDIGVNHLAWVIEDMAAVRERLEAAGYEEGVLADPHPGRLRAYFYDAAGFEWELVQYLSDDPAARHAYE